jgi:hypothetical protein
MRITIGNAHLGIHPGRARLMQRIRPMWKEESAVIVQTDAVGQRKDDLPSTSLLPLYHETTSLGREFDSLPARQIASKIGVTALNVLATLLECSVRACFEFSFE